MDKEHLDELDQAIAAMLAEDGQASVNQMAEQAGVTGPTIRARMKSLMARGALKVVGLVNPFRAKGYTVALVGITIQDHKEMDAKLDQIAGLTRVQWAAVVTGGFDILAEVLLSDEISDLYRFINQDLSQVGGVRSSETFVVMQARNKWVRPIQGTARGAGKTQRETQARSES